MDEQTKQQQVFTLTITKSGFNSPDDKNFKKDNLTNGKSYEPVDAYYQKANGYTRRDTKKNSKGETIIKKISRRSLAYIACNEFGEQIYGAEDKEKFPICETTPNKTICGIYSSKDDYKKNATGPKGEYDIFDYHYKSEDKEKNIDCHFYFYCYDIFSSIRFVQECLIRWGEEGDKFVLKYRKTTKGKSEEDVQTEENDQSKNNYKIPYSNTLIESKNLVFRGAPGTGKSYLAKQIAADIISNGKFQEYDKLSDEQKEQVEFVQFHPSYDYSDFVEGLRPKVNDNGTMGFELQDGIFKEFVERARTNYENSQKTIETIKKEISVQEAMEEFFSEIEKDKIHELETKTSNKFTITDVDDKSIHVFVPSNATSKNVQVSLESLKRLLESGKTFKGPNDVQKYLGAYHSQSHSYCLAIFNKIREKMKLTAKIKPVKEEKKDYIFIIDEINRGEISKILGELFFSIDPGYRGEKGAVTTQYANMHKDPKKKFYIPENVYIIGTMNDIDRSVDTFDFAMRRRFRFVEIKADEHTEMLAALKDEDKIRKAIKRMKALNKAIADVDDLGENYQIGASYFLKLKEIGFDELWTDYLEPLLQEYVRGMYNEKEIMKNFKAAYGYEDKANDENTSNDGNAVNEDNGAEGEVNDEAAEDQG